MLLQPLVKKLARYLNRENRLTQANRFDGLKPCFKALRIYIVSDNRKAVTPYRFHRVLSHRPVLLLIFSLREVEYALKKIVEKTQ